MWRQNVKLLWVKKCIRLCDGSMGWGSLLDCPTELDYDDCLMKFEILCSPWLMFVNYVKQTWLISHKLIFVKVWTNKMMHLGNTTTNMYENRKCILVLIRTH